MLTGIRKSYYFADTFCFLISPYVINPTEFNLMNEQHQREEALFDAALQLPAAERGDFLNKACAENHQLRKRIESLLKSDEKTTGVLEQIPERKANFVSLPPSEKPGDLIGRYKLLEQIGEGGCGVVYLAEQEEPVRRKVALKIIKLGMDTRQVIARFEAERQALAMMDHPNIAKVLDAGATETGRPYFVMELVRGTKITDYCDENNFSARQRLDLFMQVCRAVQHAHQKGIIHRDLKPSNILVTLQDGAPMPIVIDFGIAKATGGLRLTDQTFFTAFEQFLGTPAYMSPEQAQLTNQDIDTRSDIYSLGVLLYELLTGGTPFDQKELLAAGLEEMRRTIRETEPPRPSTRLSSMAADASTTTANHRHTDVPKLIHLLRGDLDWIVMKALDKDRTRRYETANGLAMDLHRHLNNEPILARPPSSTYRLQKLVRRNRIVFVIAASVTAALVFGLVISGWSLAKEKKSRQEAENSRSQAVANEKKALAEAAKSQQIARFLGDMLEGVGPSVALGRDTAILREILDKAADRVGGDLSDQPSVEAELLTTIGEIYFQIAQYEKAEVMHRKALALYRELLGENNLQLAVSLDNLARAIEYQGKQATAEPLYREALKIRRKVLGNEHPAIANSLNTLAQDLDWEGKTDEAENLRRESLAMQKKLFGDDSLPVAGALTGLAVSLITRGKLTEAENMLREALAIDDTRLANTNDLGTAMARFDLAIVLERQGKLDESEAVHREVLALRKKLLGNDHPDVAASLDQLAGVLQRQMKLEEAESCYRESVAINRKASAYYPGRWEGALNGLVDVLMRQQKYSDAEELFRQVITPAFEGQPNGAGLLSSRAVFAARRGQWEAAAADLAKVIQLQPAGHAAYHMLAPLLVQKGDADGYHRLCRIALARFSGTKDPFTAERIAKDCLILPTSGVDLDAANQMAETAVEAGKANGYLPYFEFAKGLAEYRQGRFAAAAEWAQKVLAESVVPFLNAQAYMVLAMAQHRLNHTEEARSTFAKGVEIVNTKLTQMDSGDLGVGWTDWIIAHALMTEATALIGAQSAGAN